MSEISLAKGSAMASPKQAVARVRTLLTELNLHLAGVALLLLVNIYLMVHLFFVWRTISSNNASALQTQAAQMRSAETAAEPLRGLDAKVKKATDQADEFSSKRLPYALSGVLVELGALAKRENVRLTRSQYTYEPVLPGSAHELERLRMDVSLSGDYRPLVHVVNALERDKMFFLIESMTLTGQQSGTVNLRLRLVTYLRAPLRGEGSKEIELGSAMAEPVEAPAPVAPARPYAETHPAAVAGPVPPRPVPNPAPAPVQANQNPNQNPNQNRGNSPTRTPLGRLMPGQRGLSVPRPNGQGGTQ